MITESYLQNIFDNSYTERIIGEFNSILYIELPNGYVFSVSSSNIDILPILAKEKIRELESYLERDKEHYGYDTEGEYE